jgi:hypothetical protein
MTMARLSPGFCFSNRHNRRDSLTARIAAQVIVQIVGKCFRRQREVAG